MLNNVSDLFYRSFLRGSKAKDGSKSWGAFYKRFIEGQTFNNGASLQDLNEKLKNSAEIPDYMKKRYANFEAYRFSVGGVNKTAKKQVGGLFDRNKRLKQLQGVAKTASSIKTTKVASVAKVATKFIK